MLKEFTFNKITNLTKNNYIKEKNNNYELPITSYNNRKYLKLPYLMMIRSINFSLISPIKVTSSNIFEKADNSIYIGLNYLCNITNNNILGNKTQFYIKLLSFYYETKDNINYISLRKLLSNILLKKIIMKKFSILKYYFIKYHSRTFSEYISYTNINIIELLKINSLHEEKINQYQNLLKNYETKNESQNEDQNNQILNLKKQMENTIQKYEDIIAKNSKEHTQELMNLSNENITQRQKINELNKQIEEQKKIVDNLNEKIKSYEDNDKQKEINIKKK